MYGLGIRIGTYLLWFTVVGALWLAPTEVPALRFVTALFSLGLFVGLVIATANNNLRSSEVYIVYLLSFGTFFFLIPLYLWKGITCFSPLWDPGRFPRVPASPLNKTLNFALLLAITSFALWFWSTGVEDLRAMARDMGDATGAPTNCPEFGFLFAQVAIDNTGMIAFNILFNVLILIGCVAVFAFRCGLVTVGDQKKRRRKKRRASELQIAAVQELQSFLSLAVAGVVIAAIELTIQWSNIQGVGAIDTAAQTIPLVLASGLLIRCFYIWMFMSAVETDSDTSSFTTSGRGTSSHSSRARGIPVPGPMPPPPVR